VSVFVIVGSTEARLCALCGIYETTSRARRTDRQDAARVPVCLHCWCSSGRAARLRKVLP
jgi:hypothetical protein